MKRDRLTTVNTISNHWVITEALDKLKRDEYQLNFRREATRLYCFQLHEWIRPEDFTVDRYYFFEDVLNPDAERILYAISLLQGGKGFLIDACNAYMDNISPEMMEKLQLNKTRRRKNKLINASKMTNPNKTMNEALTF